VTVRSTGENLSNYDECYPKRWHFIKSYEKSAVMATNLTDPKAIPQQFHYDIVSITNISRHAGVVDLYVPLLTP
jgi:hypothetical protein